MVVVKYRSGKERSFEAGAYSLWQHCRELNLYKDTTSGPKIGTINYDDDDPITEVLMGDASPECVITRRDKATGRFRGPKEAI